MDKLEMKEMELELEKKELQEALPLVAMGPRLGGGV